MKRKNQFNYSFIDYTEELENWVSSFARTGGAEDGEVVIQRGFIHLQLSHARRVDCPDAGNSHITLVPKVVISNLNGRK